MTQPAGLVRRDGGTHAVQPWPDGMYPEALARWAALVRSSGACVRAVDLAMYRSLRSTPTWGRVTALSGKRVQVRSTGAASLRRPAMRCGFCRRNS